MSAAEVAATLLRWYGDHGRDLPWRHTRDPYAIWLSEVIMQQTRIAQGQAYWERFMETFPTVERLAAATEDEVLRLWQGLGYYSRARNLHKAAQQIVALGRFPDTLEAIRQLQGVGDYTAAAIAAFAFGVPAAAVDGNFHRVLARVFGIDKPVNSTGGRKLLQAMADALMEGHGQDAADLNSAVMDFGALQCTPKSPVCTSCPLCEGCVALREGRVDELPVKLKTTRVKQVRMAYVYVRCNGQTAIRRRGEGDIWQGLWEPPTPEMLTAGHRQALQTVAKGVRHVLTHRVILADFYLLETPSRPSLPTDYLWIDEPDLDRYAIPRLVEILLERL